MKNTGDITRNFLKKILDKCRNLWYSIKVARGRGGMADTMVLGAIAAACGFKSRRPHHFLQAEGIKYADMAELADALDSGSSDFTVIQVQVLLSAPAARIAADERALTLVGVRFLCIPRCYMVPL